MALTARALFWGTAALLGAAVAAAQAPPAAPTPSPTAVPGAAAPAAAPAVTPPAPAASPAALAGPAEKIVGIRVVGYQTVSPDTIAHYLGIKVGDPYD
ncbi:MAG TPA: hypothetical protein VE007_02175, partial [Thermoanaerobaculia bacterium]|nr:hypothetical protein [Thermoanaerobaculia bacterium]